VVRCGDAVVNLTICASAAGLTTELAEATDASTVSVKLATYWSLSERGHFARLAGKFQRGPAARVGRWRRLG